MLVKFTSKAHGDIIMFGDIALRLIKMMGHSGTIPGAIDAETVSFALEKLKRALEMEKEAEPEENTDEKEEDDDQKISLQIRAFPLVEMLTDSSKKESGIMWDKLG